MRRRDLLLLAPALLVPAACTRREGLEQLALGETGTVREVVSGHFLVLQDGLGVRLAGVVAPKAPAPHGEESLQALRALVADRPVRLLYGGRRRDTYDRAIAQVRLERGGDWVQGSLLDHGAVRVKTWADNRAQAARMLEWEARARNAGRGLWGEPGYRVRLPREISGGFEIVEGRVRRAVLDDGELTLAFDDSFVAIARGGAVGDFAAAGLEASRLQARLLRLRGIVRSEGDGMEMRLDHPEQVELLRG